MATAAIPDSRPTGPLAVIADDGMCNIDIVRALVEVIRDLFIEMDADQSATAGLSPDWRKRISDVAGRGQNVAYSIRTHLKIADDQFGEVANLSVASVRS